MHEGKTLARILKLKGLTRQNLADKLGIHRQSIQDWVTLETLPAGRLKEIEKVLGVKFYGKNPIEYLLGDQQNLDASTDDKNELQALKKELMMIKADLYDIKKKLGM